MMTLYVELCTDWPVSNDGCLYAGRESTADREHVGGELDDEVLQTQWSVNDDAVQERDYFRCATAGR